ncbi:MAG: hypothetical protein IJW08_06820 [Lentisphaeria bacterium]|nr:hypothetical protein [Lentisphaeria bacterium]
MLSVFIKELRQFSHSQTAIVMLFVSVMLSIVAAVTGNSDKFNKILPWLLAAGAQLVSGIYQLTVIAIAGSRWKNENGDGSIDIVRTTPISPLSVTCAKMAATLLVSYPAFALTTITTLSIFPKQISLTHLLVTAFMQTTSICAVSLGCATFQERKKGSFDWGMLAAIIAAFPVVSMVFQGFSKTVSTDDFIAANAGLAAVSAFGTALCVCGTSPKSSDRAFVLKLVVLFIAIALPITYKYTSMKHISTGKLLGTSLFFAAVFILAGALFERTRQSRRVLSNKVSKLLFLFNTGVANSFFLYLILSAVAIILSSDRQTSAGTLAKILFFTGICQISRDKKENKFPFVACVVTVVFIPAAALARYFIAEPNKWIVDLILPNTETPIWVTTVFALAGTALYSPFIKIFIKQYLPGKAKND